MLKQRRRPGGVSIIDVADLAGVSPATAGRVLGGYGYASEAKAELVRQAAAALGYRANLVARGLITGRTQTIGVVAADIASPFYAAVVRSVADAAQAHGLGVLVTNSDEEPAREQEMVRLLLQKQVDGLIVAPSALDAPAHLAAAVAAGCPVVQVDRVARGLAADSVTIDNVGAARACVRRLVAAGHRRIGIVAELPCDTDADIRAQLRPRARVAQGAGIMPSRLRLGGYVLACREAGLALDPRLVRRTGEYSVAGAQQAVRDLLAEPDPPTALFTADGTMSIGAMQALAAAGVAVPSQLSLVCFDDLDWMAFVAGGITAACQPARAVGSAAVELLVRRIDGDDGPAQHVEIPVPLVERGSVAPPRASGAGAPVLPGASA